MTHQERLMLAALRGAVDGYVRVAKAQVRAAFKNLTREGREYGLGYRAANRRRAVEYLRGMRDIQRHVHEYCKGMGYDVRKT